MRAYRLLCLSLALLVPLAACGPASGAGVDTGATPEAGNIAASALPETVPPTPSETPASPTPAIPTPARETIPENKLLTRLGYTQDLLFRVLDGRESPEKISGVVQDLPSPYYVAYVSCDVTEKEINIQYQYDDSKFLPGGNRLDPFSGATEENSALLLFAAVEGLEKVNRHYYDNRDTLNHTETTTWEDVTGRFGLARSPARMGAAELYGALAGNLQMSEFYFAHYERIFLGGAPSEVTYRNGKADEMVTRADGSSVWVYSAPDPVSYCEPPSGFGGPLSCIRYYYNSPEAEKDGLTGLYATEFDLTGGETLDAVVEFFGAPDVETDAGDGMKAIAYSLREENRRAYFVFHDGTLVTEGIVYGVFPPADADWVGRW